MIRCIFSSYLSDCPLAFSADARALSYFPRSNWYCTTASLAICSLSMSKSRALRNRLIASAESWSTISPEYPWTSFSNLKAKVLRLACPVSSKSE